jgi:hypothetical protein
LPLFLQKESGFQGKALRISIRKNHLHTLTEERFQKVVGSGNARLPLSGLCKSRDPQRIEKSTPSGILESANNTQ